MAVSLSSCALGGKRPAPPPPLDVKIYQGSSSLEALIRSQENEVVACESEEFNDFVGVSHEDFSEIVSVLQYCYDKLGDK